MERFKRPVDRESWTGEIEAVKEGNVCIQTLGECKDYSHFVQYATP